MELIIKAIEEKLEKQEGTIFLQRHEIEELKRKLEKAEKTIESQAKLIEKKGDKNEAV